MNVPQMLKKFSGVISFLLKKNECRFVDIVRNLGLEWVYLIENVEIEMKRDLNFIGEGY